MGKGKKTAAIVGVTAVVMGGALVGLGQTSNSADDFPKFNDAAGVSVKDVVGGKENPKKEVKQSSDKADIAVDGDKIDNIREERSDLIADYCRNSKLPAGEGKDNKGGTCVSFPIGEVAKNPVRVAVTNAPTVVPVGQEINLQIKIEDRFGPLDLNAFTHDENDKAGDTFLEHPGELDKDGRPLLHCHLGVTTLAEKNGLPGESYDAAFSGVQGLKGDLSAKIGGLDAGFYRGDVYCGQPGHAPLPTALATNVQAFTSFNFQVN